MSDATDVVLRELRALGMTSRVPTAVALAGSR